MLNITPLARFYFKSRIRASIDWASNTEIVQRKLLRQIVHQGRRTKWGRSHVLNSVHSYEDFVRQVPISTYEDLRPMVMRMVNGEPNILWPGVTRRFAQSSGTSGGKSKYIPLTDDSLKLNHYAGSSDVVAHYLNLYPDSRLFAGKAFILGGSYANELSLPSGVLVGDLSANLIDNINPLVNLYRVPDKEIALMEDWRKKLPKLIEAACDEDITNISGVPSWFLTVLKGVIERKGARTIHDVWPNLEVFFHGGISFKPYHDEYARITDPKKMRYLETYNASEGFFAVQNDVSDPAMLLLMDIGVFYEFVPLGAVDDPYAEAFPAWEVEPGKTYALVITACNGLWRYMIGDTVRVESVNPLKITIAGRTKNYINAFGEELMVYNADAAITKACQQLGCTVVDYTAAPEYATNATKGRHEWWIQWGVPPRSIREFESVLDKCLQDENSDYQAKRSGNIFLDNLTVHTAPKGLFDAWLAQSGKLGGQRKIPRLCNDRHVVDSLRKILRPKS